MLSKVLRGMLLLGAIAATVGLATWGYIDWTNQGLPDEAAMPAPVSEELEAILETQPAETTIATTTSSTLVESTTTSTLPPVANGDEGETVECASPVDIHIYLSMADMIVSAPIDLTDGDWYPDNNRTEIHTSKVNGLPCADTSLPVKLLGHKQHQFCSLVIEPNDSCKYGVSLGDRVLIVLEDDSIVEYAVVAPLDSQIATPLSEVYAEFYESRGIDPTPAVMMRKWENDENVNFQKEVFSPDREDASGELWLFTSCGNRKDDPNHPGHSTDTCAVRTEFVRHLTVEDRFMGIVE